MQETVRCAIKTTSVILMRTRRQSEPRHKASLKLRDAQREISLQGGKEYVNVEVLFHNVSPHSL